jgi:hypothetical protein
LNRFVLLFRKGTSVNALSLFESFESRQLFAANLVSDAIGLRPAESEILNGAYYFLAAARSDGLVGLWKSDGSGTGTQLVMKPATPEQGLNTDNLWKVGNRIVFLIDNTLYGSDGTAAGTEVIKSGIQFVNGAEVTNGKLVVQIGTRDNQDRNGTLVIATDGTASGTVTLVDLPPFLDEVNYSEPYWVEYDGQDVVTAGERVIFWVRQERLFSTDGTVGGTIDLSSKLTASHYMLHSTYSFGDRAVFFSTLDPNGMWVTDGTLAGTDVLKVLPNGQTIWEFSPRQIGDRLYFSTTSGDGGAAWVSDGTTDGTRSISDDFVANFGELADGTPVFLTGRYNTDPHVLMTYSDDVGLTVITTLPEGWVGNSKFATVGGLTFFQIYKESFVNGVPKMSFQVWYTDGTAAGTGQVPNVKIPSNGFTDLTVTNNLLLLSASYASGRSVLVDPAPLLQSSEPPLIYRNGNRLRVVGTSADDDILIYRRRRNPDRLMVSIGSYTREFPFAGVGRIYVDGLAGDDLIQILEGNGAIAQRTVINGGSGDDNIQAASGRDGVTGGAGNDTIVTGARADTILGEEGDDVINAGRGQDLCDGGDGADSINGSFDADVIYGASVVELVLGRRGERATDDVLLE